MDIPNVVSDALASTQQRVNRTQFYHPPNYNVIPTLPGYTSSLDRFNRKRVSYPGSNNFNNLNRQRVDIIPEIYNQELTESSYNDKNKDDIASMQEKMILNIRNTSDSASLKSSSSLIQQEPENQVPPGENQFMIVSAPKEFMNESTDSVKYDTIKKVRVYTIQCSD